MAWLTSPTDQTPWPVFQHGEPHVAPRLAALRRFHARSVCYNLVSGPFHLPTGVLFSVPSRYYCAIGLGACLGLGVDAPRLHARFPTHATQGTSNHPPSFLYGAITLYGAPFQETSSPTGWVCAGPYSTSPLTFASGFGLPCAVFDRLYSRHRNCFLFHRLLGCFTSAGSRSHKGIDVRRRPDVRFGHPRFTGSLRLPVAFRGLARPSSAPEPSHPPDCVAAVKCS